MRVVLFMRRRRPHNFSVEQWVERMLPALSPDVKAVRAVSRFESKGIVRRLYDIVEAGLRQGDVNHVTGDVNFLTYLLDPRRTVLTILDCGVISGAMDLRKRAIKLLWFSLPVRRCAVVTVISHAVKADLLRHVAIHPDKVRVVGVAVSERYRPVAKPFDAQRPTILQVGTGPNKNVPRLIEALAGLSCRLHIVGELSRQHRALLERHAIDYRNFTALSGEEMFARYVECDMVSFVSTFEGFGMPIVEANLVGRPVVTGNVGSMPEVAGSAACIVDCYRASEIRAGIERVAVDAAYREQLVRNGFENARRFDGAAIARQYESIYRELFVRCR